MKNKTLTTYLLLGAMVVGLFYFAYYKPKQASLKTVRNERIQAEQQVEILRVKKRQLDAIEAELVSLNSSLSELETIIPQKKETSDILRNIQQMAFDQQLDLVRFAEDRETARDFYTEWPIPIVVNGHPSFPPDFQHRRFLDQGPFRSAERQHHHRLLHSEVLFLPGTGEDQKTGPDSAAAGHAGTK